MQKLKMGLAKLKAAYRKVVFFVQRHEKSTFLYATKFSVQAPNYQISRQLRLRTRGNEVFESRIRLESREGGQLRESNENSEPVAISSPATLRSDQIFGSGRQKALRSRRECHFILEILLKENLSLPAHWSIIWVLSRFRSQAVLQLILRVKSWNHAFGPFPSQI
jgi:hypothetical protein